MWKKVGNLLSITYLQAWLESLDHVQPKGITLVNYEPLRHPKAVLHFMLQAVTTNHKCPFWVQQWKRISKDKTSLLLHLKNHIKISLSLEVDWAQWHQNSKRKVWISMQGGSTWKKDARTSKKRSGQHLRIFWHGGITAFEMLFTLLDWHFFLPKHASTGQRFINMEMMLKSN